ncbi:hypothetical protein ACFQ0M_15125 [Kitasatospora aburaviensis]
MIRATRAARAAPDPARTPARPPRTHSPTAAPARPTAPSPRPSRSGWAAAAPAPSPPPAPSPGCRSTPTPAPPRSPAPTAATRRPCSPNSPAPTPTAPPPGSPNSPPRDCSTTPAPATGPASPTPAGRRRPRRPRTRPPRPGPPRRRRVPAPRRGPRRTHRRAPAPHPAPCPRWAADTLRAAARTAARADRPADAVTLLRRVLDEPLGDRRRGLVLTELGSLEATLGPDERVAGVRHLAEAVDLQHSDEGVFRTANTLGAVLAARGDAPAALELMEELAERFGDRDDLVHAVQAAAALIAAHDGHSWLQVVEESAGSPPAAPSGSHRPRTRCSPSSTRPVACSPRRRSPAASRNCSRPRSTRSAAPTSWCPPPPSPSGPTGWARRTGWWTAAWRRTGDPRWTPATSAC